MRKSPNRFLARYFLAFGIRRVSLVLLILLAVFDTASHAKANCQDPLEGSWSVKLFAKKYGGDYDLSGSQDYGVVQIVRDPSWQLSAIFSAVNKSQRQSISFEVNDLLFRVAQIDEGLYQGVRKTSPSSLVETKLVLELEGPDVAKSPWQNKMVYNGLVAGEFQFVLRRLPPIGAGSIPEGIRPGSFLPISISSTQDGETKGQIRLIFIESVGGFRATGRMLGLDKKISPWFLSTSTFAQMSSASDVQILFSREKIVMSNLAGSRSIELDLVNSIEGLPSYYQGVNTPRLLPYSDTREGDTVTLMIDQNLPSTYVMTLPCYGQQRRWSGVWPWALNNLGTVPVLPMIMNGGRKIRHFGQSIQFDMPEWLTDKKSRVRGRVFLLDKGVESKAYQDAKVAMDRLHNTAVRTAKSIKTDREKKIAKIMSTGVEKLSEVELGAKARVLKLLEKDLARAVTKLSKLTNGQATSVGEHALLRVYADEVMVTEINILERQGAPVAIDVDIPEGAKVLKVSLWDPLHPKGRQCILDALRVEESK